MARTEKMEEDLDPESALLSEQQEAVVVGGGSRTNPEEDDEIALKCELAVRWRGGEDVQLSPAARKHFPYSVECKNVEKLNVWAAYEQAEANSGDHEPILIMKKNRKKPLIVIDAEAFFKLL